VTNLGDDESEPGLADGDAWEKAIQRLLAEWLRAPRDARAQDRLSESARDNLWRTWTLSHDYVAHLGEAIDPGKESNLQLASRAISAWANNVDAVIRDDEGRIYLVEAKHYAARAGVEGAPAPVDTEDVGELVTEVARHGVFGLSVYQLLAVILVVLLAARLPFVQVDMPPHIQSLMTDEEATLGLSLAIAFYIAQNRRK
jgi:hypothetical protein